MKCPHCKDKDLVMSERKGVEIDYCPDCRGVWLDRGELDKILDKSREEEIASAKAQNVPTQNNFPQQPSNPYVGSGEYGHPKYYKKRRKSFFEELFD